jgi:hypothetical protein
VQQWDGARPLAVPAGYPQPGDHARWHVRFAGRAFVLHDRVRAVEPPQRLTARITYAFVDLDEEYRLERAGDARTVVTSMNDVRSRLAGFGWLAARVTRRAVESALANLRNHCA